MLSRYHYLSGSQSFSGSYSGGGTSGYDAGVLGLSPRAFWPMDEASGNLADATGHGFTATAVGTLAYQQTGPTVDSVVLDAITFDTAEYCTVSETVDDTVVSEMTASLWFKRGATAGFCVSFGQYNNSGNRAWAIGHDTGAVGFLAYQTDGATQYTYAQPAGSYDDGAWHHVVAWIDSSGYAHIRVDDSAQGDDTTPAGTWNGPCGVALGIGGRSDNGAYLVGSIAKPAYWVSDIGSTARASLYSGSF